MNALTVQHMNVTYDKQPALQDVSFAVPEGSLAAIIGPNGAGKSTLIKAILQLLPRLSGEVAIYGNSFKEEKSRIGYVPQRSEVDWDFPTNALDVVLMGRYGHVGMFKRIKKQDKQFARDCLAKLGMEAFADRQISQLSGGQQQRVFLARALAQNADIYLMDEPFAGVDAATEKAMIGLLQEWKAQGKTVIVVHHDLQTVRSYFDHCLLLNKTAIAFGPTEQSFTRDNLQQAYGGLLSFLGQETAVFEKGGE